MASALIHQQPTSCWGDSHARQPRFKALNSPGLSFPVLGLSPSEQQVLPKRLHGKFCCLDESGNDSCTAVCPDLVPSEQATGQRPPPTQLRTFNLSGQTSLSVLCKATKRITLHRVHALLPFPISKLGIRLKQKVQHIVRY